MTARSASLLSPSPRALRFSHTGFVVFVAGYSFFQNIWLHLLWFGFAVAWPLVAVRPSLTLIAPRGVPFLQVAALFVGFMLLASLRPGVPWPDWMPLRFVLALGDAVLLLLFLRMAWRLGERPEAAGRRALEITVHAAAGSALLSILVFYGVLGRDPWAARLENVIVHFGLAPVLTGLLFGFAGLAAAVLASGEARGRRRALLLSEEGLLILAALFTHSRGTILALVAGFGVLVLVRSHRGLLAPLAVVLAAALLYQFLLPNLFPPASAEPPPSPVPVSPVPDTSPDTASVPEEMVSEPPPNPAASLVARKDAGRLTLYRLILERLETPADWVLGRGRWADDTGLPRFPWAHHPHSVYLATFYRGGAVGVLLLGAVMAMGFWSCWSAARRGEPLWLALACFGIAALMFDGDDLASMVSVPRVEPLLWWLPLAAGAGAMSRARGRSARSGLRLSRLRG